MGPIEAEAPHSEAGFSSGGVGPEGASKPSREVVDAGIGLKPPDEAGRLATELTGCLVLEAVPGKTRCTEFQGGRLETWPWEPD